MFLLQLFAQITFTYNHKEDINKYISYNYHIL